MAAVPAMLTCYSRGLFSCAQEDFQSVIDNMMKQLLSKDIMYMPMKQICDKVRRHPGLLPLQMRAHWSHAVPGVAG